MSPFLAWAIFTRARVSLALLSLRKNGGLLAVYFFSVLIALSDRPKILGIFKKRKTWITSFDLKVSIVTAFRTIVVSQCIIFAMFYFYWQTIKHGMERSGKTWSGGIKRGVMKHVLPLHVL